jgi:predicted cobalt transporter CbtA
MARSSSLKTIGFATLLLLGACADLAFACSMSDVPAAEAESIRISNYYWIASVLLGGICIVAAVYRRHWIVSATIVATILVFHPSRTVRPIYGPDCAFANVVASEYVLALIGALLAYHLFCIFGARQRVPRP